MYFVYSVLLGLGFLMAAPYYLAKGRGTGKYLRSFRERMGRLPTSLNAERRPSVWVHAVSVGEVLAARPLIGPLRKRFPSHAIYLSTTTVTGNGVARKSLRGIDGLFFAPFDFVPPVRKALLRLNPSLLVIMETELWPNLIHEAKRRGTRVVIANGRISPRSFPRYRRIRFLLKRMLSEIDLFLMQDETHAARIVELGAPKERVSVPGNLKYDALSELPPPADRMLSIVGSRPGRPLLIAGSTVDGEEQLLLRAFRQLRERVSDVGLVIAPRHPERFASVPPLVQSAGFTCARRSELAPGAWRNGEVLLLDTLGELAQVYPLATVVFVGGSLVRAGGHNVLEAAVAGKAVVVGPHMENFQEIADEFLRADALVQLRSADELALQLLDLFCDADRRERLGARAQALILKNRGAGARIAESLAGLAF